MSQSLDRRLFLQTLGIAAASTPSVANAKINESATPAVKQGETAGASDYLANLALEQARGNYFWGQDMSGSTNADTVFATLETNISGRVVDMQQGTFLVSAIPTGNRYVNGFFKVGSTVYDASESDSLISSATDTGGIERPYTSGVRDTLTVSGRSTRKFNGLLWSQNSRSSRLPRNGAIASIYSWITSLVGLILAGRQSYATQPQSIIAGCEECFIDTGSRNTVVSSIFSVGEGVGSFTGGSRASRSTGWESSVIGSNGCVAGAGSGARFQVNVNPSGVVASVTILNGGSGYIDPMVDITDRVGTGSGAQATVKVTNGVVTAVRLTSGGAGYSQDLNAVNLHLFTRRSMAVAGSNKSTARGHQSFIGGSANSDTYGSQSVVLASNRVTASGINSAVIASGPSTAGSGSADSVASGDNSLVVASSASVASGAGSVALGAMISRATGSRSIVSGRRTINNIDDSWAGGGGESGPASTANRKIHVYYGTGDVEIAGTLTQSKVFTDIAKMFENVVSGEEIPVGALVSLEGRKVRLARPGDRFFSVHTRTYVQILGDTAFTWAGRYLHDDHGVVLTKDIPDPDWPAQIPNPAWPALVINPDHPVIEDLVDENGEQVHDSQGKPVRYIVSQQMMPNPLPAPMIPNPAPRPMIAVEVENPNYDPKLEQVPRSERRGDWTPMLLQGEAFMHVTNEVAAGDYIKPVAVGIGGRSTEPTSFLCMEIMTPFDERKGYAIALGLRV